MKLLVVDDDALVRRSLARALRRRGHDVHECASAAEALEVLGGTRFDGVITDLWMPEQDGFALLTQAKQLAPETPVVIITGLPHPGQEVRALELGAEAFRKKPVRAAELEQLLGRSSAQVAG